MFFGIIIAVPRAELGRQYSSVSALKGQYRKLRKFGLDSKSIPLRVMRAV